MIKKIKVFYVYKKMFLKKKMSCLLVLIVHILVALFIKKIYNFNRINKEECYMWDSILDALTDSLKIFAFVIFFNFIFSFIFKNKKTNKLTVLVGAALGLLPQCGFSVVAAERFNKKQISGGTLLAVFIATSDEAIPVFLAEPSKAILILPLLVIKFIIALAVGFLYDLLFGKEIQLQRVDVDDSSEIECGCGHHHDEKDFFHEHVLHPFQHSVKTFLVVLIFNVIFSIVVYFIGANALTGFLKSNEYLSPLFSVLVGLIPNCAASIVISQLFISGSISFGACLGGLIANAGIGLTVVFSRGTEFKESLKILGSLVLSGLFFGYLVCLIIGF